MRPRRILVYGPGFSGSDRVLRLDTLVNPFAPSPLAKEAHSEPGNPSHISSLIERIASRHQLNSDQVLIGEDLDAILAAAGISGDPTVVASPDHETGRMAPIREAVRLARDANTLVIDERAGGFALRDHLPLFREFENVVLVRSLDAWLAPLGVSFTYALRKRSVPRNSASPQVSCSATTLQLADATLADVRYVAAANRQVMRERLVLYRTLRKLNMVRPLPSASSFVPATIERGDRESLQAFLESRDIRVHYPHAPDLQNQIRISAVSRPATERLAAALIDWARNL